MPFREILFVGRTAIEWQRVVRELRVSFVENVIFAVVPVRESCMVGARLLNRLVRPNYLLFLFRGRFPFLALIFLLVGRFEIHRMWVDDLCLFLEVESLLVRFYIRLHQLVGVVLPVV